MAKILVVDDEQDSREMVKQALEEEHEVYRRKLGTYC